MSGEESHTEGPRKEGAAPSAEPLRVLAYQSKVSGPNYAAIVSLCFGVALWVWVILTVVLGRTIGLPRGFEMTFAAVDFGTAIVAILCGKMGLDRTKTHGPRGFYLAMTGVSLGCIALGLFFMGLCVMWSWMA